VLKLAQFPCWRAHVPEETVCGAWSGVMAVMLTPAPSVSTYRALPSARWHESIVWMVTVVVGPLAATPPTRLRNSARQQAARATTEATTCNRRRRSVTDIPPFHWSVRYPT
jgi:hypothetical protein